MISLSARSPAALLPANLFGAMRRGAIGRCPRCGSARLFAGFLSPVRLCPGCGQDWTRHQADDFPAVIAHVKQRVSLSERKTEVFYVCGADHALKCRLFSRPYCIIVGRPGFLFPPEHTCKAMLIPPLDLCRGGRVSSTEVRKAAQEGRLEEVRDMLHPRVWEELAKGAVTWRK